MRTKCNFLFIVLACFAIVYQVTAQGTAFSYQGRLNDNGSPANGFYDVRFLVWDAPSNGDLVAGPVTNTAAGVTNGLFSVTLDFGGGVFTGPVRWLELDVRTNVIGMFTTLSPRQPITPTPYSIYSANAGTAATAITAVTAATAGSANSVSATNIVGTVPVAATATNAPNGTPLNSMVSSLPFCILHNNLTATIYTNGTGSNPTLFSFPNSKSAGWNDIQSLFVQSTNASHVGFRLMIDPGLYQFTTQLMVTNSCIIEGAGESATIFEYVGATNNYSLYNMTNNHGSPYPCFAEQSVALIWVPVSSGVALPGGDEPFGDYNVTLKDFSLKISTNMYCVGILDGGGDHGSIENVIVGGPQLWSSPSYFNGWLDARDIPEPSKMVGFVIGDNQFLIQHCRAVGCAIGISFAGNSFVELDNFNAIACGYSADWGTSAFPATSDYSVNAGVLIPRNSQIAGVNINNLLTYENWLPVWDGAGGAVNINSWNDQGSHFGDIGLLDSALPTVTVMGSYEAYTMAYTNINGSISYAPGMTSVPISGIAFGDSIQLYDANGMWLYAPSIYNGNTVMFYRAISGTTFSGTAFSGGAFSGDGSQLYNLNPNNINGSISSSSIDGATFDLTNAWQNATNPSLAALSQNNGFGLTNIPASAITGGSTTNILVGGHTFYITNGVITKVE